MGDIMKVTEAEVAEAPGPRLSRCCADEPCGKTDEELFEAELDEVLKPAVEAGSDVPDADPQWKLAWLKARETELSVGINSERMRIGLAGRLADHDLLTAARKQGADLFRRLKVVRDMMGEVRAAMSADV
jgi:hypothetical protein